MFSVLQPWVGLGLLKSKGIPRQAEVALGVLGRLRPRIITTFTATRVVGHQPNAPAAFTPGEDGFGGLVVSMLASGTQVCGFKPG